MNEGSTRVITSLTAMSTVGLKAKFTTVAEFAISTVVVIAVLASATVVIAVDVGIAAAAKSAVAAIVKALVREVGLALITAFGEESPAAVMSVQAAAAGIAAVAVVMVNVAVAVPELVSKPVPVTPTLPQVFPDSDSAIAVVDPVTEGRTRVILSPCAIATLFVKTYETTDAVFAVAVANTSELAVMAGPVIAVEEGTLMALMSQSLAMVAATVLPS